MDTPMILGRVNIGESREILASRRSEERGRFTASTLLLTIGGGGADRRGGRSGL